MIRPNQLDTLLAVLSATGNLSTACRAARTTVETVRAQRAENPELDMQINLASAGHHQKLLNAMFSRAVNGVPKYILYKGEPVADPRYPDTRVRDPESGLLTGDFEPLVEYQYSDPLLQTALQAALPEDFRSNQKIEHAGYISPNANLSLDQVNARLEELRREKAAQDLADQTRATVSNRLDEPSDSGRVAESNTPVKWNASDDV